MATRFSSLQEGAEAGSQELPPSLPEGVFQLMTFAVSAVDYQKATGIRLGDGSPTVFSDEKATEVLAYQI